ncbi:methylenetetrahydrofolate reductase [NAD(P)H] [Sinimarinibacterium sp. CAU 1509]|uniref:methylenetetrahydrofolate reductase [NAD(P)H] n=1 Tax=Sinimarinibacterium sp. CAU 1509 TaxID=2562283 RepID=UPI0010AD8F7A|nr:methylenetetrahydrofolate reductase [NAD(P)H] [Sinimarinibacterium sp. CAU 1509]TJY58972.1 methylenetetrahydrofolate reductase [NAD(P)H] [Sinimarinibacterium sp. CAU 1509]
MNNDQIQFSFELFPPRTPAGAEKLPAVVSALAAARPAFFSVTYGAGGSEQQGTYETVMQVVESTGIEAAPHLTCVGSSRSGIAATLQRYRDGGIRRIVALRGDLPATATSTQAPGEFRYANELVSFIRELHGDHFSLEVAAYPEMHPQATGPDVDFDNFRRKVDAGANGAVTQYFYNADAYFDFVDRCQQAQIAVPVVPGIMPITNHAQLTRFSAACGAEIPRWIRLRLERYQDDREALLDFGLDVVTRLCRTLLENDAPGLHFYSLNQSEPTLRLWRNLDLPLPIAAP